ncbi:uncharacterized protein LOC144301694 [Canis aureus]
MASGMAWGPCGYLGLVVGYLKVKSCFAEHGALGWRRLCSKPAGPRRCRSRALNCTPRGTPTRSLPKGGVSAACCVLVTGTKPPHKPPEPHAAALALEPLPGTRDALSASRGSATPAHGPPSTRSEWNLHRGRETAAHRTRSGGNVEGPAWGRAAGHRAGRRGHLRRPARTGTDTRAHRVWASGRVSSGELRAPGRFPRTGREDGPDTPRALGEGGTARGHRGRRCGTATPRGARGGRRGSSGIRVRPRPQVCGDRSGPGQAHAGAGPFRRLRLAPAPRRRPGVVGAGHAASSPGGGFGGGGGGDGAAKGTSAALGRVGRREPRGGAACTAGPHPCVPEAEARASPDRPGSGPTPGASSAGLAGRSGPVLRGEDTGRPTGTRNTTQQPRPDPRGAAAAEERRGTGGFVPPAGGGGRHRHSRARGATRGAGRAGAAPPSSSSSSSSWGPEGRCAGEGSRGGHGRAQGGVREAGRRQTGPRDGRALGSGPRCLHPHSSRRRPRAPPARPAARPPSCSAARPEARAPRGLRASPAAAPEPEPEPSRGDLAVAAVETASRGRPASPGPGRQEAPKLPGGPPPPVAKEKPPPRSASEKPPPRSANEKPPPSPAANEKPPPSPAANEKPPPRSANEKLPPSPAANEKPPPSPAANDKPPPHSANEKPPPSPAANEKPPPRSANEKPPPSPAANEKPPPHSASQHFPACESSSPAWEAENPAGRLYLSSHGSMWRPRPRRPLTL